MAPPLGQRPRLRETILDHLRAAGSDSISGIARRLREHGPGAPVHRLTVAGYLAAMADEGVLREVDRPPSKHYQIADTDLFLTLHQRVGRIVADLHVPAAERPALVVAALQHVLGRPVFQAELAHAGLRRGGVALQDVEVSEEQRREYRALFRRRHAFDLHIPHGDPLLTVPPGAVGTATLQEVVRQVVLSGLPGVRDLATEREAAQRAVQSRLRLEAPPAGEVEDA